MQSWGCAGLLPPLQHNWCCGCQQLPLRFLQVCLLSADGSAAPLPWSRMKCSLAASSQPNSSFSGPLLSVFPHLSFSPSALASPTSLVSVTLLCLSQDEHTHPICSASLNSPGKAGLRLECPSLLPPALEKQRSDN